MVALARATHQTPSAAKKAREAKRARNAYIKSAVIVIEGQRARVTSQHKAIERYDVVIVDGKAAKCSCPDHQFRRTYCKHMESTDRRLALPQLPAGVAKFRKVRGENRLVAVKVVAPTAITKEEPTQVKETPKTERRTAKLTEQPAKPVTVEIIDRRTTTDGFELDVTDDAGNACIVTLRRLTKRHSCSVCGGDVHCIHVEYCAGVENARYHAAKAEQAKRGVETKPVVATTKSMEERIRDAPLNGNRGFRLLH